MCDKIKRYNTLLTELKKATQAFDYARQDDKAEISAVSVIRELRQTIERLRRVVDDEQPPVEVRSLQDAMKLNKDELAFVAWQFWEWISENGCPADKCVNFPCKEWHVQKAECEENLKNGELDEAGFKDQEQNGFNASTWCGFDQTGCWAEY